MARISTYPLDTSISGQDKWIGTDASSSNATKNFSANKVAEFLNSSNKIESQSLMYKYQDWQLGEIRENGSISFEVPQSSTTKLFSSITDLKFSQYTVAMAQVNTFYSAPLIGAYVLITKAKNVSDWAIYKWIAAVKDINEPTFYDVGLEFVSSNGSLIKDEEYFLSLLQLNSIGPSPVSDKNFVYTQGVASDIWVVTHNLNKYCAVSVVDSAGTEVFGNVNYDSLNQVTLTFSAPFSGQAFFN
tara:strand:+ start:1988 stop:2719 length:732 start_codon:yes stop_codon:yes gene_type:complete